MNDATEDKWKSAFRLWVNRGEVADLAKLLRSEPMPMRQQEVLAQMIDPQLPDFFPLALTVQRLPQNERKFTSYVKRLTLGMQVHSETKRAGGKIDAGVAAIAAETGLSRSHLFKSHQEQGSIRSQIKALLKTMSLMEQLEFLEKMRIDPASAILSAINEKFQGPEALDTDEHV